MSALMCSGCHISMLARYGVEHGLATDAVATAQALYDENIASLQVRYPNDPPGSEGLRFCTGCLNCTGRDERPYAHGWDHVAVLKACDFYAYQACEHPGWDGSRVRRLISRIRRHALMAEWEQSVYRSEHYRSQPWGL